MYASYLRRSPGSRIFDALNVLFMLLLIFVMVYPFYYIAVLSLNEGQDALRGGLYFYPRKPTLESYAWLFRNSKLLKGALVSVLRVVVGTSTSVFCTALLAYITTVRYFAARRFMRVVFIVTMYFGGGLIPVYLLMLRLGLLNTFQVYWVPSLINAFYMLLIAAYFQNLPDSLFEAARMDGASEMRIFLQIVMPISIPVLAAISIYVVVGHWNAWFDNLIYNTRGNWDTLQIYLRRMLLEMEIALKINIEVQQSKRAKTMTPTTVKAATTIIVTVPVLLTYPFFQRYFIGGITLGSVKA
jgi:putative aldouronate transport system permease protein